MCFSWNFEWKNYSNHSKMTKLRRLFGWNFEIWAVQNCVNLVDHVKSFPTSIFFRKNRLRYSRERASQSLVENSIHYSFACLVATTKGSVTSVLSIWITAWLPALVGVRGGGRSILPRFVSTWLSHIALQHGRSIGWTSRWSAGCATWWPVLVLSVALCGLPSSFMEPAVICQLRSPNIALLILMWSNVVVFCCSCRGSYHRFFS